MKQNVIEFFQNLPAEKSEQFNQAFELYRKSPNKNSGVERSLNVQGYSERTLENLLYDLQKMHGITDVEKVKVVESTMAVVHSTDGDFITKYFADKSAFEMTEEELITYGIERQASNSDLQEILDLAVKNNYDAISSGLIKALAKIESDKLLATDPNQINVNGAEVVTDAAIPLREEFPFLNDKECPNELKILVADKITAWKAYEENHAKVLQIESGELVVDEVEKAKIAKAAIVAFQENQAIYAELNAYKETGKVLGVHPIFKTLQMQREVDEMTPDQLVKYKGSSAKYFTDNKDNLAKAEKEKNAEKIEKIKARVADRELKLAMVNKKIGIPAK